MTLREHLTAAVQTLKEAGVPSPEYDARALILHALNLSSTAFLLRGSEGVDEIDAERLKSLVQQRAARLPLQHLLGAVEWGGVQLRVDRRALIPRPETEWLLHLALADVVGMTAPRVVDVGTGTGALALGFKAARPEATVLAADLSPEAVALARENALLNLLDVGIVESDLLAAFPGPLDLILANLPYLPDGDRAHADPEVRHDPDLALYSGPDGLALARRLIPQARAALAPAGVVWLELDPRNAPAFAAELRSGGWDATLHSDLTGRERFVRATLSPSRKGETIPAV
ncbi:peptide chain release factor N(5)-glutamine methyltransferase [Deinococcus arenicola]|uniref:Release factor glutamine methyltransferase n=1 Tax=Deinococcus arenicola TaxID=2994950 RepID=A0ABU4DRD3_9DEIO|nr:peptide chain release factor N(5)-glutamine methyltransferase [Deinococcus sp. ZS9-10]MDV6374639.1 peptide chain release factor N(5)-glutamine methyltransferase [Deinococcus sp. ZS9-10]